MRKFFVRSAAAVAATSLPVLAFAQSTPPTTAVGLAQSIDMADATSAGLIIVAALVGVGVIFMGARLVLRKFGIKI